MTEEEFIHERLRLLNEDHAKTCRPLYDRLAQIAMRRPLPPILLAVADISSELRQLIERDRNEN